MNAMPETKSTNLPIALSQRARLAGGQPISELMAQALAHPDLISLAAGFVDQATLPVEATSEALDLVLSDPKHARTALQYGTTPGFAPLRELILSRLLAADGLRHEEVGLSTDQVVMTAGSNQMLHLIADTLLDPGDIVICGAPSYFVFLGVLANLGARSVGVPMDEDGIIPEALEETLMRIEKAGELDRVKFIYCTSYFDNPASVSIIRKRRPRLVEIAQRWSHGQRIHLIEDAAYRELRYEGEDLPSLRAFDPQGDTVIVAGTFSKSFSPGIRVGWGILPKALVGSICEQKGNLDFGSANLPQHVMHAVFEKGLYEPHVEKLCTAYKEKQHVMLAAADKYFASLPGVHWGRPKGGLYVWLTLPESIDTGPNGTLFNRAMEHGMLYVPGQYCFPKEGPAGKNTIRLSFGVQTATQIKRGMHLLAEAIEEELKLQK